MSLPPNKNKQFSVVSGETIKRGHKIIIYGESGIGKSSLAKLAPKPVFLGPDDGSQVLQSPPPFISGTDAFVDMRRALTQQGLFDTYDTIVFDNITDIERNALPYVFLKIPLPKIANPGDSGKDYATVEGYGYHKGYRYWYDTMRLLLQDCDQFVRQGKNVVFIAQNKNIKEPNPAGEEFLKAGPSLLHEKDISTLNMYVEWCDHVFRIGYSNVEIKKGKITGNTQRAVFTQPEPYFYAKSRTLSSEQSVISFENQNDDSLWRILFNGK
jgi:energy-coupling factor transporter ATP-binding protein EcfA2